MNILFVKLKRLIKVIAPEYVSLATIKNIVKNYEKNIQIPQEVDCIKDLFFRKHVN
ncbi:hypothetical protein Y592_09100 [Thermosipho sp. 1070]|nr:MULTISPECIES: hypothetical protein [unclassified Thermosipho (in: thermotogales)]ANQ54695.1 hypothetical protein Y592_09100 [Thermosipho sp. 1070]